MKVREAIEKIETAREIAETLDFMAGLERFIEIYDTLFDASQVILEYIEYLEEQEVKKRRG